MLGASAISAQRSVRDFWVAILTIDLALNLIVYTRHIVTIHPTAQSYSNLVVHYFPFPYPRHVLTVRFHFASQILT